MCLELARECLETAKFFYDESLDADGRPHPNAAHIALMLADDDADQFLDGGPRQAVVVRKYRQVGPWRGGC